MSSANGISNPTIGEDKQAQIALLRRLIDDSWRKWTTEAKSRFPPGNGATAASGQYWMDCGRACARETEWWRSQLAAFDEMWCIPSRRTG